MRPSLVDFCIRSIVIAAMVCSLPHGGFGAESLACVSCHREIYESFRRTPMAVTSGPAGIGAPMETFTQAVFTHAPSGFQYRINRAGGRYWMEFEKPGNAALRGKKALAYFVGSGAAARSYLLNTDDFLYEAPVAYYSAAAKWNLAPAYDGYPYPYLTRPIQPGCLNCHASSLSVIAGTQNKYAPEPFREGGVACERCHGAGEAHIERMRSARGAVDPAIVNPANLEPGRRDSVCAQCHLSGEVRVMRPGANWTTYRPGDRLSDSVSVFVRAGTSPGMRVTSHFENLAQSACKRAAGDRLWCGSCHDPHAIPTAAARAAWFRQRCLTCHAIRGCTETSIKRTQRKDDCTGCHMPKSPVADAQHVVYTDHAIPRRPRRQSGLPTNAAELVPFGNTTVAARDLALAYGIASGRTHSASDHDRALRLLEETRRNSPDDSEALLYLAEMYRNGGQAVRAIPLYRRAIELDPAQVTASVGLGGILFERGEYPEAIRLWQDALSKNAGLVLVGTNLAMAQWRIGDLQPAESTIRRIVDLSPAFQPARDLLTRLEELRRRR